LNNFDEFEKAKNERSFDSPLLRVVEKWLRADFEAARKRLKQVAGTKTKVEQMGDNDRAYGDKYYNYWRE
jgi:CCR4-NOT complex subunit CAF16